MPLPNPQSGETESEFISRCIETISGEFDSNEQRLAVCYQQWRGKSAMNIERKGIKVDLKDAKDGTFVARIATLGVRDKDNDITRPGAFTEGKTVLVSAYMHGSWMGRLPVGKATIHERGNEAVAEGQFNLNTTEGRDTYEAVKFAPELQEWSYGFYPELTEEGKDEEAGARILVKVNEKEISPVLVGAGVNTGVLAIKNKSAGMTYAEQAEAVLAAVNDLADRTKSLADLRLKEGRTLSPANRTRIQEVADALVKVEANMKTLLAEPRDDKTLAQAVLLCLKIKNELSEVIGV